MIWITLLAIAAPGIEAGSLPSGFDLAEIPARTRDAAAVQRYVPAVVEREDDDRDRMQLRLRGTRVKLRVPLG